MSIIGHITGAPLFTTPQEALVWAHKNRLTGYHEHNLNGKKGYMGGRTHHHLTTGQLAEGSVELNTNPPPAATGIPQVRRTRGSSGGGTPGMSNGGGSGY